MYCVLFDYLNYNLNYLIQVNAIHGVGKINVAPRDGFLPFPSHYIPGRPHPTAIFVRDYWENISFIKRELRAILSSHSLAVDHQRKVVKRTRGGEVVGHGGQSFTICGDFGLVCGVYVVPDTALLGRKPWRKLLSDMRQWELRCQNHSIWIVLAAMVSQAFANCSSQVSVTQAQVLQPCGARSSVSS